MPFRQSASRRNAGVSLVELMVVVAIVATLMMIGLPSYKYVTTSNRVSGEINTLLADMQLARSEAVKEGTLVTICTSTDKATCVGGSANGWNTGWIVFSDLNGNGTFDSSVDSLIKIGPAFNTNDTITTTASQGASAAHLQPRGLCHPAGRDNRRCVGRGSDVDVERDPEEPPMGALPEHHLGRLDVHTARRRYGHRMQMRSATMKHSNRGFSLVEMLVALLVISIGLLGIAKMQALALSNTSGGRIRALAAIEAGDWPRRSPPNRNYWGNIRHTHHYRDGRVDRPDHHLQ